MDDIYQEISTKSGCYRNEVRNIMNSAEFRSYICGVTEDDYVNKAVAYVKKQKLYWKKQKTNTGKNERPRLH